MRTPFRWLRTDDSGQGLAEYGVILLIVAAALVGTLTVLQGAVGGLLSAAAQAF